MTNVRELWDFEDPAGSEARFRAAARGASGAGRAVLLTQVARALGLQGRYAEAHALLDELAPDPEADHEVATRTALERGRLLRSAGSPDEARPLFDTAAATAGAAGLASLHVDALHMAALVAAPEEQVPLTRAALAVARASTDPGARDWDAALLNNLGMTHADAGDFAAALPVFEEALAACRRIGDPGRIRIARWMVAWSLRHLGRTEEARATQLALREELAAAVLHDPYVDEELGLLG